MVPATVIRAIAESFFSVGFLVRISDNLATMLGSHFVSMGLFTPLILFWAYQSRNENEPVRTRREIISLFAIMVVTTLLVLSQSRLPLLFIVLLPLVWISFRLSQIQSLVAATMVIVISCIATAEGMGPISLVAPDNVMLNGVVQETYLHRMSVLQMFAASVLAVVLPMGAIRAEEARAQRRGTRQHGKILSVSSRVRKSEQELLHIALHDKSTGMLNRVGMEQELALLPDQTVDGSLYVAAMGIERYTALRSALGSDKANELVEQAGRRISNYTPDSLVGRTSPEELAVAFWAESRPSARNKMDRLRSQFVEPLFINGNAIDIRFSTGLASKTKAEMAAGTLLHQSEVALIQAREMHLPLAFFDAAMEQRAASGLTMLSDLRAGLERGEVWLSYQPKLNLNTGMMDCAECLLRWNRPDGSGVNPDDFITLAEETGFIDPLTDWVIEQAIVGQKMLDDQGTPINIAVNISVRSISDLQFASRLTHLVERCGGDPHRITLEITESAIMVRTRQSLQTLTLLRDKGFTISIDDFGTGQSSLSYLRYLPADEIKIDRSFITDLMEEPRNGALVRSTIELAQALKLNIVAEGVQDDEALAFLLDAGCNMVQSHHIVPPMTISELAATLRGEDHAPPIVARFKKAS